MPLIRLDAETRSHCELKTRGAYAYAEHPTTEAICLFIQHPDGWRVLWTPIDYPGWQPPFGVHHRVGLPWLHNLFADPDNVFLAHNSEFDSAICELTLKCPKARWIDSMALADYLNLPAGLDALATNLWGTGKDDRGYKLMLKLCKPNSRINGYLPITHDILSQLVEYNIRDVELMERFWDTFGGLWADSEESVFQLHQRVNRRGVCIDIEAAVGMLRITQEIAGTSGKIVEDITRSITMGGKSMALVGTDLTRVGHLQKWFNKMADGAWTIDAVDEETLTTMLAQPDEIVSPIIKQVADARLSVSLASVKKLQAMLNQMSGDQRLRGQYRYCIAEGTPVLTDTGWKPIETLVAGKDQVWDGVEWVHFEDLLDNEVRQCICIDGVWLTPDHKVLDATLGWVEAEDLGRRPYQAPGTYSENGRLSANPFYDGDHTRGISKVLRIGMSFADVVVGAKTWLMREILQTGNRINAQVAEQQSVTEKITISYLTTNYEGDGGTDGTVSFGGARTPHVENIKTMEVWESESIPPGGTTRERSTRTYRHSLTGGILQNSDLKSTESNQRETTSLATSGSSRVRRITATDETAFFRRDLGNASARESASSESNQLVATPLFANSCAKESPKTKFALGARPMREARVYDLYNAGPRHRFQAGALLVSNCGAAPGRWSGRGVQLQNLPRPTPWMEEEDLYDAHRPQADLITNLLNACRKHSYLDFVNGVAAVDMHAKSKTNGEASVSMNDALTSLIRPMIIPAPGHKLIGADFAQIEGRGAAWMAGDKSALEAFANNDRDPKRYPDVYCIMASDIFGRTITKKQTVERSTGKASELGLGYGMGAARFNGFAGSSLAKAGVAAEFVVQKWRERHRAIVKYWYQLDRTMRDVIASRRNGVHLKAGPMSFERENDTTVLMHFPSGRSMRYHGLRIESDTFESGRSHIVYDNHRRGEAKIVYLHGAKILENSCQGLCRDLLTDAMCRIDAGGIDIVMHTHDEPVAEVPDDCVKDAMEFIGHEMCKGPAWADGFPIKGEPSVLVRYGK